MRVESRPTGQRRPSLDRLRCPVAGHADHLAQHSAVRIDALARQGVVAHNQDEDPNREKRVNKPTKHSRNEVKQDAKRRSKHLRRKSSRWQVRLQELRMAMQMPKSREPRYRHQSGY